MSRGCLRFRRASVAAAPSAGYIGCTSGSRIVELRLIKTLVVIVLVALTAVVLGLGGSTTGLEQLARSGRIEWDAPIQANVSILIDAPPSIVWRLLTDIDTWPRWQSDITAASLKGRVVSGTAFTWRTGDTDVVSELALVRPTTTLSWTEKALGLRAVHMWTLSQRSDGRVLVRTRESMGGFPSSLFYSSTSLVDANRRWLVALRHAGEAEASH